MRRPGAGGLRAWCATGEARAVFNACAAPGPGPLNSAPDIRVYATPDAVATAVAEMFASVADEEVGRKGFFTAALSGGTTPVAAYRELAGRRYSSVVPWGSTHLFWGDERCVGPEHPESNYRAAADALLARVPIPEENIHRMQGELAPADAARAYEGEVIDTFGRLDPARPGTPRFDLVLLGLGADGHTLSIFPGTRAAEERQRLVVENHVESLGSWRLTMTMPLVNSAARVVFLVTGEAKAEVLARVMSGAHPELPASMVRPAGGTLIWLVDSRAAKFL